MENHKDLKVAFIHGRPSGHPTHAKYAQSLGSTFFHEDRILRWQDLESSKAKRYLSWLLNAVFFKDLRKWDVILTECVRIPQLIQKRIGLLSRRQKLIALMSDESLYFTVEKVFPRSTQMLMRSFWESCDIIICIGQFQTMLAKKALSSDHHHKIYTCFNGIPQKKIESYHEIQPNLDGDTIVFVGNAAAWWRAEYKGLDQMIQAFLGLNREVKFQIIGKIKSEVQDRLLEKIPNSHRSRIEFVGEVSELAPYFKKASLYLHTANGEAWGNSILEAMAAGLPCIVSDKTGAKEIVEQVDKRFVTPLSKVEITQAIEDYFDLSSEMKQQLSEKGKQISSRYTEEKAIQTFQSTVYKALAESSKI